MALVTCPRLPRLDDDDLPLAAALRWLDVDVHPTIWSDADVDWAAFDLVVLRSCWDYDEHPAAFRRWIDQLAATSAAVWNPPDVLAWNLDKRHLADFAAADVPIIPTVFVEAGSERTLASCLDELDCDAAVVKPTISFSAHGTWRTTRTTACADEPRWREQLATSTLMVQQFVPEIVDGGEWSLVHLEGRYAHTCLKRPAQGDFRVQSEFGGQRERVEPGAELLAQAERVLAACPGPHLYSRVDGVVVEGTFLLMEVELIDPQLFLTSAPESADVLARILRERC